MLPKAPNKYCINIVFKCYEHIIQGANSNSACAFKNSILTILKATEFSKAAGQSIRALSNACCKMFSQTY